MRYFGVQHFNEQVPVMPDRTFVAQLAAGTAIGSDWLSSGSTALTNNCQQGGTNKITVAVISFISTAGIPVGGWFNGESTGVNRSTGGQNGSTVASCLIPYQRTLQLKPGSTGFSLLADVACFAVVEMWCR